MKYAKCQFDNRECANLCENCGQEFRPSAEPSIIERKG